MMTRHTPNCNCTGPHENRIPFDPPYSKEDLPRLDALHEYIGLGDLWRHSEARLEIAGEFDKQTVADVFDTLTEKQKNVVYFMIGQAIEDTKRKLRPHF
jgi:hypothetical protein